MSLKMEGRPGLGNDKFGLRKELEADTASEISEITFPGYVIQVREDPSFPEPGKIRFLHRFQGKLRAVAVGTEDTLGSWHRRLMHQGRRSKAVDGYFSTKGVKILSPDTPVELLGLMPELEVVFQGRLRRGGFQAAGRVPAAGGGNFVQVPGDWTCSHCG